MGNCLGGEFLLWGTSLVGSIFPSGELSWWGVVLVRNCPGGDFS